MYKLEIAKKVMDDKLKNDKNCIVILFLKERYFFAK